jgi:copper chaperone CopZ
MEKTTLTRTYAVSNISCAHCTHTIEKELRMLQGVRSVSADLRTRTVVVVVDGDPSFHAVEQTLDEIGYPVAK